MSEATVDIQTAHSPTVSSAPRKDAAAQLADYYRAVADRLPGADLPEVREWRDTAVAAFIAQGLPHRRIEEWKYTDLRAMLPQFLPLAAKATARAGLPDYTLDGALANAYTAVFIDGRFDASLSSITSAPGVRFDTLAGVLKHAKPTKLSAFDGNFISAVSAAFASDGTQLSVSGEAKLDRPLHIVSIATSNEPALYATQNRISIGNGAELTLIETHIATAAHQTFTASQIDISEGAQVKHLRLLTAGGAAKHLSTSTIEIAASAAYDPLHLVIGGALTRIDDNIRFTGAGARCHLDGAMLLGGREHADITLVVDHAAPACESRETVKAVLDGTARGVFQAKVIVQRGAQKTDGRQMARGLLLSETAEFDAKPELEIYADDVKCNHGATSGALDDDMLFYLQSRGIPEPEAKSLLVLAFVGEIIDHVENEGLREALMARASRWLASADGGDSRANA